MFFRTSRGLKLQPYYCYNVGANGIKYLSMPINIVLERHCLYTATTAEIFLQKYQFYKDKRVYESLYIKFMN